MTNGFTVAPTLSPQARQFFVEFWSRTRRDGQLCPEPDDLAMWRRRSDDEIDAEREKNQALVDLYKPTFQAIDLDGVPALDIRPASWREDDERVLVYTHGGGYVGGSAAAALAGTLPLAEETGLRIVSIDYTLAPEAQYDQITAEVVRGIATLYARGHHPDKLAIYGDSAGASLAASSCLRLRDEGHRLPAAVVLWSPWSDISNTGDTYLTLAEHEPCYLYDGFLAKAALAYAPAEMHNHPYVSPVYGDFAAGFPPTLIQVGTRELFLSNAVRLYQAIDQAGQAVKLDVYEAMWHVFQFYAVDMPEALIARGKTARFLESILGTCTADRGVYEVSARPGLRQNG